MFILAPRAGAVRGKTSSQYRMLTRLTIWQLALKTRSSVDQIRMARQRVSSSPSPQHFVFEVRTRHAYTGTYVPDGTHIVHPSFVHPSRQRFPHASRSLPLRTDNVALLPQAHHHSIYFISHPLSATGHLKVITIASCPLEHLSPAICVSGSTGSSPPEYLPHVVGA